MDESAVEYDSGKDFTTLRAWEKARLVKLFFYAEVIPLLPLEERFNLHVQIRKAGVSGTANISEGYGRHYFKDGIKFYRISRGSLYELKDHLISCHDLVYITDQIFEKGIQLIEDAKAALNGYIRYVERKTKKTS